MADFLADGRAARLAKRPHPVAERVEPLREQLHLRGFAAAFRAFKGDEQVFHYEFGNIEH